LEMLRGHDSTELISPFTIVGLMLLDMLRSERREVIFGAGKVMDLENKRTTTMAGQLDAARDEASELNGEYDELAEKVRCAVDEFERFVRRVNGNE
jgi:hypothetical protein